MPQPPHNAWAVRGGAVRDALILRGLVLEAVEDGDGPVLSIFCAAASTGEASHETLRRICEDADIPHGQVQVSSVGRLVEAGFEVKLAVDDGESELHHHVLFALPVTESQVQAFIDCFGQAVPNPTGGKRRKR